MTKTTYPLRLPISLRAEVEQLKSELKIRPAR